MKLASVAIGMAVSVFAAACCAVGANGGSVRFIGQTNIVIWDESRGMEHFIRDATFETKGKDLGFLAPTPSQPELSEAGSRAFALLDGLKPKPWTLFSPKSEEGAMAASASAAPTVVHEQDVAGFHAAVLKASDTQGLTEWLKKNGYPAPKFLDGWAKPYVEKGWYMTAFKVKGGDGAATGPVRMSFATKRPFNPYSVPAENGDGNAQLRLYYVSAGNEIPRIGGTEAWREAEWKADIPEGRASELASELKLSTDAIPANATVTSYTDDNFGQSGKDDLYFVSVDGRPGLAAMGGVVALVAFLSARRRSRRTKSSS